MHSKLPWIVYQPFLFVNWRRTPARFLLIFQYLYVNTINWNLEKFIYLHFQFHFADAAGFRHAETSQLRVDSRVTKLQKLKFSEGN